MKQWQYERKLQIYRRVSYALLLIALLIGAFALGMTVTFEQISGAPLLSYSKVNSGLYAGFTAENFLNYTPEVVADAKDKVAAGAEEPEAAAGETKYTAEEYELLAKLIYRETGAQGLECMIACGSVVINRVNSHKYPNTIKGVIYQRGQYSVVRNTKRFNNTVPSKEAYYAAKLVLNEGSQIPASVLFQGKNKYIGSGIYRIIEGEVFCYGER